MNDGETTRAEQGTALWQDGPWRLRRATEEEADRYDAFVGAHRHGDFLQGWAWGDLKAQSGWRAHRCVLEQLGRWRAAATILERRLPLRLGSILYAPRGPVLDYDDHHLVARFCEGARAAFRGTGALFLKMDPDVPEDRALDAQLRSLGAWRARRRGLFEGIQPRHVMRLDLDRPLDAVFSAFTAKCRYNIRLAERKGVVAEEATESDLPIVCRLLHVTAVRDGFGLRPDAYYVRVYRHTVARGLGRILLARVGDEYVAATWTVQLGDKAWYLYGASSDQHREKMPNYLLQWEAIRWSHGRGARMYDFLGVPATPDPSSRIVGLWRFKERFSPSLVSFVGEYDLPIRPLAYRLWRLADPAYAKSVVALGRLKGAAMRLERGDGARHVQRPQPRMP